jgi:hypothetical protein
VNGLFSDSFDDEQAEKQKTSKKAVKMQIILFIVTSFYLKILNIKLASVQHSVFRNADTSLLYFTEKICKIKTFIKNMFKFS